MEKSVAEKLLRAALALVAQFGAIDIAVSQIPDEAERKGFATALGDLIRGVNDGFIRPLVRQFPNLDPDT